MKIKLIHIAEIIEDVTGISLTQMRMKFNYPEFAEARYLFLLVALKYGDYRKQFELTNFINTSKGSISSARKIENSASTINIMMLILPLLEGHSNKHVNHITIMIDNLNNADKIIVANNIINQIPAHQKQLISI